VAAAYQAPFDYLNRNISRRMAADNIGVSDYEGIAIREEIEESIREIRGYDPYLDEQITTELDE